MMNLLAISSPGFIPEEAEIISSLFREGLTCLHIRKPESDEKDYAQLLSEIEPEFRDKIAIHQHHHLAFQFGIKRLHFTEKERKSTLPSRLEVLAENFILSTSIHELTEMETVSALFSYTFFGPVFDSISKSGYKSVLSRVFFIEPEIKKITIIALGGINSQNLEQIGNMNFDGAAVLGTLWENPENAIMSFRKLREVVNFINQHES